MHFKYQRLKPYNLAQVLHTAHKTLGHLSSCHQCYWRNEIVRESKGRETCLKLLQTLQSGPRPSRTTRISISAPYKQTIKKFTNLKDLDHKEAKLHPN